MPVDANPTASAADAQFVHDEWRRRTLAHDIDGLLALYLPDATFESPLVPRIMETPSGVLTGHDQLREFFVRGIRGRPNDLVRFHRSGAFHFDAANSSGSTRAKRPRASRSILPSSSTSPVRPSPGIASTGAGSARPCSLRASATPGRQPR